VNELDFRPESAANTSGLGCTAAMDKTQRLVLQITSELGLWNHIKVVITYMFYLIHYTKPL